ncbi:aminopeptidase P family protein [Acinetobacter sp. 1207_04]|uniref:aminopeptidase P family protein n=1 Tax=Acinetobacter sp. 1207_04 TaxID=2604449 RepID=UPI00405A360A
MNPMIAQQRLNDLRTQMQQHDLDAFIAMSADPHMSEYLPEYWQVRLWLTGFTGSVGIVVVTQNFAGLWVDGRYWVQAEQQLENTGFVLQKQTTEPASTHLAWLAQNLPLHATISVNGQTLSVQQFEALNQIAQQHQFTIQTPFDIINEIWTDRPALPQEVVWQMANGLNAQTRLEKLSLIRSTLNTKNVSAHFISALDDIAWILNCRGQDVEYNPVFLAHLFIDTSRTVLFIDDIKLSKELHQLLAQDQITVLPYTQTEFFLSQLSQQHVLIDPAKVSILHTQSIQKNNQLVQDINPSTLFKSRKHATEITHIRNAMTKDGVALSHFFYWLETALTQNQPINELTIDEKITAFRAEQVGFIGLSFSTIAGFNANGALPHYRATKDSYSQIQGDGLLLIDSGAQYHDGTTDITRVIPIGTPSTEQKRDYTLVLKCHIALAQTVFPEGIASPLLDAITRQTLWKYGLDYRHGTGHGVGFALNVHEGPQVISYYAPTLPQTKMREGMITSNEPGLYHEGKYGIRIENLVVNQTKKFTDSTYGEFLEFETLTLCPINQSCIALELMTESEITWLNEYHQTVRERLAPHLQGKVLNWLIENTQAI